MSKGRIKDITGLKDVAGKRVLVRTAFDVPMKDGVVQSRFRIERSIATITHLILGGARVILLTHLGRDPRNTVAPLVPLLQEYFPLTYVPSLKKVEVERHIDAMKDGDVVLLENLRSEEGEEENDDAFSEMLASFGDLYVNDAFSVSHRTHASIVGIPRYLPSYAGISFMDEYHELEKMLNPKSPSLFMLGGAKFETKEPLVAEYCDNYTNVFLGGAIANDFLKAKGYPVGDSLLSTLDLSGNPLLKKENIILPIDVVVVGNNGKHEVLVEHVAPDEKILDVGPRTVDLLAPFIARADTILWNGPLGNYEAGFDEATKACAELIAQSEAFSIVGGGDTVTAIEELELESSFGFVSTAGGAMLDFLEHRTLPGIEILKR